MRVVPALVACLALLVANASFGQSKGKGSAKAAAGPPLGLLPVPWPVDNPYSANKVDLRRLLYLDKRLSVDNTHAPEH